MSLVKEWDTEVNRSVLKFLFCFKFYQIEIRIGKIVSPKTDNNMNISHVEISGYIYIDF